MNSTNKEILPQGYRMTELGPLPKEWEIINLDEIIDLKRGISWRKDEANKKGNGIPVIGIPNIKENGKIDFIDTYFLTKEIPVDKMLRINDILFVGSSGSIKNIGRNVLIREIQKNKFTYASFTFLGRVDPLKANSEYIFYLLNSPMVDYNKYARRASDGKYNFQLTQFKNEQKLPLPPLPEQQKIAAVLSAVQETKDKTQALIDATKALKKSMMKHLFTYGPVSPEETKNVQLKETEIGKVPEDWEVVKLGEIGEFQYGYTASASREKIGPQFLRITDIDLAKSKIEWSDIPYCEISDKDYLKYRLNDEDILFTRIGATTGKTCIVKNPPKSVFASYLIRYKVDLKKVIPFFIYYFTTNKKYWDQINASKEGKLKKGVNSSQLKIFDVPLPPLPVQQRIASILSAIDAKIEAEENKKQALEELFKTLLDNLMTAKIRVNTLDVPV